MPRPEQGGAWPINTSGGGRETPSLSIYHFKTFLYVKLSFLHSGSESVKTFGTFQDVQLLGGGQFAVAKGVLHLFAEIDHRAEF